MSGRPKRSAKAPKRLEDEAPPPPPPRKPIPVESSPLSSHASSISPQNTRTAPSIGAAPPPKRRKTSNASATAHPTPAPVTTAPIAFPAPRILPPSTTTAGFPQPKSKPSFPTPSFPQPSTSGTTVKRPIPVKKPAPKIAQPPSPPPQEIPDKRVKAEEEAKTVTAAPVEVVEVKSAEVKGKGGKGVVGKGKGKEAKEDEVGKGKGKEVVAKGQPKVDVPTPPPRKRPRVEATSSVPLSSLLKPTLAAPIERKSTPAAPLAASKPPAKDLPSTNMDFNDKDAYSSLFTSISFKKTGGPVQKAPILRPGEVRLADPAIVAALAPPPISREAKLRELKHKRESEQRQLAESAMDSFDLLEQSTAMIDFETTLRDETRQVLKKAPHLPRLTTFGSLYSLWPAELEEEGTL